MINALSIDVEDYFHVTAFERSIRRDDWGSCPLRVVQNTERILDMLDAHHTKATFFILGWVAERCAALVRDVQQRGHEIACHGYGHELVYRIGPKAFRDDIRRSKAILEDICGLPVLGYRAPSYSITRDSLWAFDILVEEGFHYDSSIFPIYHDIYGMPDASRFPHEVAVPAGTLKEFPMTTLELKFGSLRYRLPVAGGGYLRLFPVRFIRKAISFINDREEQPVVIYVHPWEVDPDQPRIKASPKSRFRHYLNLDKTEEKVGYLLRTLQFSTMGQILAAA